MATSHHAAVEGAIANRTFLPFEDALLYACSLKLIGEKGWYAWSKSGARPSNLPSAPDRVYKLDGWQGFGHWLGTGSVANIKREFLPFDKALLYVRALKLKSQAHWQQWRKSGARPSNIPGNPDKIYKNDGWQGTPHWLGTGNSVGGQEQQFMLFNDALLYARSLKLKSQKEWKTWCKSGERPGSIPGRPDKTYTHDGWQGFGHWLGTSKVANLNRGFLPFDKALLYVRSLKLKTQKEWYAWSKSEERPDNIPAGPRATYKHDGWQGFRHWLGTATNVPPAAHPPVAHAEPEPSAPTFASADYGAPHTGLEVQECDQSWRTTTLYQHVATQEVVLWFGGAEYEGIGCGYRWDLTKGKPRLLDGDGCKIRCRSV